ncbi:MAG: hypothetical protein IJ391_09330 [Clostridia bacterium]|nr:hypothetical protein [Clostridia bacterium]
MYKFVFLGGDSRAVAAHKYLLSLGYDSLILNVETNADAVSGEYIKYARRADVLVLPAPLTIDGVHIRGSCGVDVADIFSVLAAGTVVFAGGLPSIYKKPGSRYINYLEDEKYVLEMAYLTAEGTLGYLLSEYPRALRDSKIVITGWGRIAKYLHRLLTYFTNQITVVLRREDIISELMHSGQSACNFELLGEVCANADIVINTVPSEVISKQVIDLMDCDICLIDLASKPGGIDFPYARELGLEPVHLLSLPGKCAPVTAGDMLSKCILNNL